MKLSSLAIVVCIGAALPSAAQMRIDGSRVIEGTLNSCTDTGSSGAYACNLTPAISGYVAGSQYCFQANSVNAGAATLNLNGLGPKAVRKYAGGSLIDLDANDIVAGQRVCVIYDGTYMQLATRLANEGGAFWKAAGPGGITAGTICKYNTDGTIVPVSGNESILGICATTASSGAVGKLITVGNAACIAEGAVTQNDFVGAGNTSPSHCKDLGQSARNAIPATTYIAGRAATSAADGGTVSLELFGPGMTGTQATGTGGYNATASAVPIAGCAQWDSNGNVGSTGANCGSGSVQTGNTNQIAYYPGNGATLSGQPYVPVAQGGTGQTTYTDGQLLIGSSLGNGLNKGTLSGAGSLSIVNGHGSVTLTGGSGVGCAFDGGGAVVAGNSVCYARAPFGCTLQSWSILAQGAGPTATLDIWKVAAGTALPTAAGSIAASSKPTLSTGNANTSGTLTGWTTTVSPGDIFGFHVDAVSNATWIEVRLLCQ